MQNSIGFILIGFIFGLLIGGLIVYTIYRTQRKEVEKSFSVLSLEALRKNSEDFLKLAGETLAKQTQTGVGELEGKKQLIDHTLQAIKGDLEKVEKLVNESDSKREKVFGEVSANLKTTAEQTGRLQETTTKLQAALANTKVRGQWGERMAEDILQHIGFVEGVNYQKQKTQELVATRPDFTFVLPQDLRLNMDVKFPLDNYMKYFSEENEVTKEGYKQQFLKDARQRIKEVTGREYINPAENTLDYVLVFVPSEQVYCFIHENDQNIIDEAIKNKAILCSPLTLYAILAVIRQQVDNFRFETTASRILSLIGTFNKQWNEYKKCMESMGKRIEQAAEEYQTLSSRRSRMLERPLKQIDDLKRERGIEDSPLIDEDAIAEISEVKTQEPDLNG